MIDLLRTAMDTAGYRLSGEQYDRIAGFAERLLEKNRVMNLTAITDPVGMAYRHFYDCLTSLFRIDPKEGAAVIDVGCGGGFPGIPFAIARPDLAVTLLDATRKKLTFLDETAAALGIANVRTIHARAEEAGRDPALRERFDLAVARAVAPLGALAEMTLPFVRVGGIFAAQKGPDIRAEREQADRLIARLGGGVSALDVYTLPSGEGRTLLRIEKQTPTPPEYPRGAKRVGQ